MVIKLTSNLYKDGVLMYPKYSFDGNNILVCAIKETLKKISLKNTNAVRDGLNIDFRKCTFKESDDLIFKISKRSYSRYKKKAKEQSQYQYDKKRVYKLDSQYEMDEHIEVAEARNKNLGLALLILCLIMIITSIYFITK